MPGYTMIDPKTGDYVQAKGRIVRTDANQDLQVASFYRLKIHRTKWMYAPDQTYGSDMYLMHRRISQNNIRSVAVAADRALQPIVDSGRAVSATNAVQKTVRGTVVLATNLVTAQGEPIATLIPIGG